MTTPLSPAWLLMMGALLDPTADAPSLPQAAAALDRILAQTTPASTLSTGWAALGTLYPYQTALGLTLLLLAQHRLTLAPDTITHLYRASTAAPFGSHAWQNAVEQSVADAFLHEDLV